MLSSIECLLGGAEEERRAQTNMRSLAPPVCPAAAAAQPRIKEGLFALQLYRKGIKGAKECSLVLFDLLMNLQHGAN